MVGCTESFLGLRLEVYHGSKGVIDGVANPNEDDEDLAINEDVNLL